jgi:DNA-binding MarR family transcriptional regulator
VDGPDSEGIDRLRGALTRISRRIDRQTSAGALTSTQSSVLASIAMKGPIGLGELADFEGVNPTMLSRVVGKLEDAGLIERRGDESDRRAARVEITPAGSDLRRDLLEQRSALLAERLATLPKDTVRAVLAAVPALEELADVLVVKVGGRPSPASAAPSVGARA